MDPEIKIKKRNINNLQTNDTTAVDKNNLDGPAPQKHPKSKSAQCNCQKIQNRNKILSKVLKTIETIRNTNIYLDI